MKKIAFLLSLAVLTGMVSGCGSSSSSAEAPEETSDAVTTEAETAAPSTEEKTTDAEKTEAETENETSSETASDEANEPGTEAGVHYLTSDNMFSFDAPASLKRNENGTFEECEFVFEGSNGELAGVMTLCGYHYSAAGFMEGIADGFAENYGTVETATVEVNGLEAEQLTASGEDTTFVCTMVQYGNGDIFALMTSVPSGGDAFRAEAEKILSTVEYSGKELKTKDENYSGKGFSMTVGPDFYLYRKDDYNATIKYNLADSLGEYTTSLKVSAEKVDSVSGTADDTYEQWRTNSKTLSVSRDTAEILGHQAEHIYRTVDVLEMTVATEYYIFDDNGTAIAVTIVAPQDSLTGFRQDIQPVLDSIKIK